MHPSRMMDRVLALVVIGILATACTDICEVRGGPDLYGGTQSFIATVPSLPAGAVGTTPSTATVDWDPYEERRNGWDRHACGDLVAVTIVTQGCTLEGDVTSLVYETKTSTSSKGQTNTTGGRFLSATANIAFGTCTLPIDGTSTVVNLTHGYVAWDDTRTMHITTTGTSANGDVVTVTFEGATTRPTESCAVGQPGAGATPPPWLLIASAGVLFAMRQLRRRRGSPRVSTRP